MSCSKETIDKDVAEEPIVTFMRAFSVAFTFHDNQNIAATANEFMDILHHQEVLEVWIKIMKSLFEKHFIDFNVNKDRENKCIKEVHETGTPNEEWETVSEKVTENFNTCIILIIMLCVFMQFLALLKMHSPKPPLQSKGDSMPRKEETQ